MMRPPSRRRSMQSSRREFLTRGLLCGAGAMVAARELIVPSADAAQPAAGGAPPPASQGGSPGPSAGASASLLAPSPDHPKPAGFDRLDEPWYRATIGRLQE